jgi:classical protein kinase C/novel protein kinase C epsilon type
LRKPLTGLLTMRIQAVQDVDHATSSRFSRGPETSVIVKVEDTIKARTRATRSDRWQDETFNLDIDKANEVELTVYDKAGDRPVPIGMLWLRISDIAEEMRRKKIETEINTSGWVSADKMERPGGPGRMDSAGPVGSSQGAGGYSNPSGPQGQMGPGGGPLTIDAWFALEPVGRIHLSMSFGNGHLYLCYLYNVLTQLLSSQTTERQETIRHWS